MTRYCYFCGHVIRQERMNKSPKVRFCSDSCRFADSNERQRVRKSQRRNGGGNTRVYGAKAVTVGGSN